MMTPVEIKTELDKYIVGQERAKRTLATAVHEHYLNVAYDGPVRIKKANLLLMGPTGVGKTYLCATIARILDVPFAETTATSITPAGWQGDKAWTAVEQMYLHAKQQYGKGEAFKKARTGIVYIDEIDKLAFRGDPAAQAGTSVDAKFNTIQIQQALLRVIEGTEIIVDGNPLDTSRVLFIGSGAFVGLDLDIKKRLAGGRFSRSVGSVNPLRDVISSDLIGYGLIPEFVGRFPVVADLEQLTDSQLVSIIRDVKDSLIEQKRAMLSVRGCDLSVDEWLLRNIAREALAQGTGARGVQTKIEKLLEPHLFDLADGTMLTIGIDGVQKRLVGRGEASSLTGAAFASPPSYDGEPIPLASPVVNAT